MKSLFQPTLDMCPANERKLRQKSSEIKEVFAYTYDNDALSVDVSQVMETTTAQQTSRNALSDSMRLVLA